MEREGEEGWKGKVRRKERRMEKGLKKEDIYVG